MNKRKLTIKEIADSRGKTPAYIAKNKFGNYVKDRRIEAVENYDVACSEDFEGWVLHHRKEAEKTAKELLADKEYFYALPEDMIWLRIEDHEKIHEEINKLPWRQEMETERHRMMKRNKNVTWTEEMREAQAVMQKAKWTPERKRKHTELCDRKRENGENTVNVNQLDGREGYREYQRQYRKIHYASHKEEWKDYLMRKSYEKRSTEELLRLLDKKKRNTTLPEERKNRLINMIIKELNKRDDYKNSKEYQEGLDTESIEYIREQIDELNRKLQQKLAGN